MLLKDKDILVEEKNAAEDANKKAKKIRIDKANMRAAWGDAFDYYLRGISEKYLRFRGRATRLEFWGFAAASGIVFVPVYILAEFAEMPMLPYYFSLATLIPMLAVTARRLHDINKSAALYLGIGGIIALSGFFAGVWAMALLLVWAVVLVRLLSRETDLSDGFYGAPNENDEIYGEDNLRIIKKFRSLALSFFALWLVLAAAFFDDWRRQKQQAGTIDSILNDVSVQALDAHLTEAQAAKAEAYMREVLKKLSGKTVSPETLGAYVREAIEAGKTFNN